MELIISWLSLNWFESTAALLGLISIYFQIKQKIFYWPIAILMVSMYIVVFYKSGFYADMSLQFYYLGVSIYGWYFWIAGNKQKQSNNNTVPVSSLNGKQILTALGFSTLFFTIILIILKYFTDSEVPYGDAFTTALSFVATWLLARKILENWLFWLIVNVVSSGLYIYKELYATAVLFIILSILAVLGYVKWKKTMVR
jgi:nicotinamide mononucleotide transporter